VRRVPDTDARRALEPARARFRRLGREVLLARDSLALHRCRLRVALELPGAEPTQGALADLLHGCVEATTAQRHDAFDLAARRLPTHTADVFLAHVKRPLFPACSRLATRWSVLVQASLDIPPRSMRCSSDDSRQLAMVAVAAWHAGDEAAQLEFLDHCCVCDDTLAFMLARRHILRRAPALPPRWAALCTALQTRRLSA
jgi:hypothetical protein